ncbi:methylglyoxalase [Halobacterium noricense]|uniref:Methylglyoxalase n=2 Tax=Haladaptatus pallidirubidus TaxID=1008152 RepID=A0AAV3ULS1_9EURY
MVTRIVEDQDEAVAFYTEKLGFKITRDHPGPHGRFVAVAPERDENAELVLMSPDGFDDDDAERMRTLIGSDFGLIYEVDDCRETYEELHERGVDFRNEPEEMDWGVQAVATDSDGNEIVIQEPPRASRSEL